MANGEKKYYLAGKARLAISEWNRTQDPEKRQEAIDRILDMLEDGATNGDVVRFVFNGGTRTWSKWREWCGVPVTYYTKKESYFD